MEKKIVLVIGNVLIKWKKFVHCHCFYILVGQSVASFVFYLSNVRSDWRKKSPSVVLMNRGLLSGDSLISMTGKIIPSSKHSDVRHLIEQKR